MTRRVALPLQEWRELGVRGRRQVRRAARRGQQHPEPYVAELARAWATETLRIHGGPSSVRERVGNGAVLAVLGAIVGPDWVGASLGWDSEGRLARRILALPPRGS